VRPTCRLLTAVGAALALALCTPAPARSAGVDRRPHDQRVETRPDEPAVERERHEQAVIQRELEALIEAGPDAARVATVPPEPYATPEDAEILEGWTPLSSTGAAARAEALSRDAADTVRGWEHYAARRHAAAAAAFTAGLASADPEEASSARLGLAYTQIRMGRRGRAIEHLATLVRGGYRLGETRPILIGLLIREGRWGEAEAQIARLPARERTTWERRLREERLVSAARRLPPDADAETLAQWIDAAVVREAGCLRPDLLHPVGRRLEDAGRPEAAAALYQHLLNCELPPDLRLGIVSRLADLLPEEAALAAVGREQAVLSRRAPERLPELHEIERRLLKRRLARLAPESAAAAETAAAILDTAPEDREARTALAWHHYHGGRPAEAEAIFEALWRAEPSSKELALALGYARLNAGRPAEALEPLGRGAVPEDADTRRLREAALRTLAAEAAATSDWDRAGEALEQLLALDPQDREATEFLAWTRLRQGRRSEARPLLEESFASRPDPGLAAGLLGVYAAEPDRGAADAFADRLARDPDPAIRAAAGGFFFDRGAPLTAAQLDPAPDRCYTHADSPRLETFLYHRSRDGRDGLSRLEETAWPVTAAFATELGRQWSASLTGRYLSSGEAPESPRAGRFFRYRNGGPVRRSLVDDLLAAQPDVGLELEGRTPIALHVGTTPIGAPVAPTPTFSARIGFPEAYLEIHRCSVKDSILSYAGQRDPYGSDEWGRVTRNGVEAGKTWALAGPWWVSAAAGADAYRGEKTWDNHALQLNAALGRTDRIAADELSYGLFVTARHFQRNSDFFTYGHGGYYSPELMTMIGPFVRFRTAACRDFWFDLQLSAGWLHQRLDASPAYPLADRGTGGLTPEAAAELSRDYDGDTDNQIGVSFRIQGMKLLTPHVAAGAFAAADNTADHLEWRAGVGVQIFFEPQNLFWTRRDMLTEFGGCNNR
jgi:tetratricopeptide (TPR) repeat protein